MAGKILWLEIAVGMHLCMAALTALTGLVRRRPGKQPRLARSAPRRPGVKHMTRRTFSAKQCSESNSAAAGFFRSLALAPFLASSAGEAFRGCSGGPGAEFDQRIVLRPCRLARASLCAAVGANATPRRALATTSRQQNLPAARTRLRMTALMALTGLVRRTPGKQPRLARSAPRRPPGQPHDS